MKKRTATIIMVLLGSVMFLVIAGMALTAWVVVSVIDRGTADRASATKAFDEVRGQFTETDPVIRIEDHEAILTRKPPRAWPARQLTRLHVLAWDADEQSLTRATVPFWLLRFKEGPIELSSEMAAGIRIRQSMRLTVSDVEHYGPALLLDERRGPDRVLVWTD